MSINKPYRCDRCKARFGDSERARLHVESSHGVSPMVSGMMVTKRKRGRWSR